jgi:hypothetical protein
MTVLYSDNVSLILTADSYISDLMTLSFVNTYDIVAEGESMARGKSPAQETNTLEMALLGYEMEKQRIEDKIREVQSRLGRGRVSTAGSTPGRKRNLSPAARRRISAAQKKRWAEHRRKAGAVK